MRIVSADEAWSDAASSRTPVWSGNLTDSFARAVPSRWRPAALNLIKGVHTTAFLAVGAAILVVAWDGLRGRPRRRTGVALAVALAESSIYASNNQVCPLTPLTEKLGARNGAVADIFLPDWFSQRIPLFGGAALLVGLVLNAIALVRDRAGAGVRVV